MEEWHKIRKALSDDDVATWKPLLDQVQDQHRDDRAAPTRRRPIKRLIEESQLDSVLRRRPDRHVRPVGRRSASDLAVFKANRLEPDRVYRVSHPLPASRRAAGPDLLDRRRLPEPDLQSAADAERIGAAMAEMGPSRPGSPRTFPEPAQCLLAIQDARIALSRSPDDWMAFRSPQ